MAGNWKMYKTVAEGAALVQKVRAGVAGARAEVLIAPPFTALRSVAELLRGSGVGLMGQNMHAENEGAFTGEISPVMLREVGCSHVILGHSERRQLFNETDAGVAGKARAALSHGLTPLICVGETGADREGAAHQLGLGAGRALEVVDRQVERALRPLSPDEVAGILLAYEPVWAVGSGKTATPAQAQEMHSFIRKQVGTSHGEAVAGALRILYGGSVKPDNIAALMAEPDVDGALVGGASLDAESFLRIVHYPAS